MQSVWAVLFDLRMILRFRFVPSALLWQLDDLQFRLRRGDIEFLSFPLSSNPHIYRLLRGAEQL